MEELNDFEELVPESLKKELLSEVDNIRDSLQILNLFTGELMLTGLKTLQTEG